MGFRYLIAIATPGRGIPIELGAAGHKQKLNTIVLDERVVIISNRSECWARLADRKGVVVGHLFPRSAPPQREQYSGAPINAHGCDDLLQDFWGAYVALAWAGDRVEIMRDPSGLLSCYYIERKGVWYFASDALLLVELGLIEPAVDWRQVARTLFANELPEKKTSIVGVNQLLAGVAVIIDASGAVERLHWDPWVFATKSPIESGHFREIVDDCLQKWSTAFASMLIGVSGGLDSSILAVSLCKATSLQALTVSTEDAHGDESAYATTLCMALGIPLTAVNYELDAVDIDRSTFSHCPRPGGRAQLQAYDAAMFAVMDDVGADAFVTGVGGDNFFQFTRSARPLVDRYLHEGFVPGLIATLVDISRLTGASIWTVLKAATRVPRQSAMKYRWPADSRFLTDAVVSDVVQEPLDHPWLEGPVDSLPGKAAHVAQIIRAQSYLDGHDRRRPFASLHPLFSQPIVEACLAVPSWQACAGGIDRAFARHAFASVLPADVLGRRSKGGPDGFAHAIIRKHLSGIRERLLDGLLADQRLVDRAALEASLTEGNLVRGEDYVRILLLLDTEAWVREWRLMGIASIR